MQRFWQLLGLCLLIQYSLVLAGEARLAKQLSPDDVREHLRIARLYFEGGRFEQSRNLYDALLEHPDFKPYPPPSETMPESERMRYEENRQRRQHEREEAFFYLARSDYELAATSPIELRRAIRTLERLADNKSWRRYENPLFSVEARYWAGRAWLRADGLPSVEKLGADPLMKAIEIFDSFQNLAGNAELDANIAWFSAQARLKLAKRLQNQAVAPDKDEREKQYKQLVDQALQDLRRITNNYSQSQYYAPASMKLMNLNMEAGLLKDAEDLATVFLKRIPPGSPSQAYGQYILARVFFLRGDIDTAVMQYREIRDSGYADDETRLNTIFELAQCYALQARAAGQEQHALLLTRARTGFVEALREMENTDPRRPRALFLLSEILIEMKEYEQARLRLQEIAKTPSMRVQVSYLLGIAMRNLGDIEEAVRNFEVVIQNADSDVEPRFLLNTLQSLAALESARGAHAEAWVYYTQAREYAGQLRDYAMVAESDLGRARSLVELGDLSDRKRQTARDAAAAAFLKLMALGRDIAPENAHEYAQNFRFRIEVQKRTEVTQDNYDKALEIITLLRQRYSTRVRSDELDFIAGKAHYRKVLHTQEKVLKPEQTFLELGEIRTLREQYDHAANILETAAAANSRGRFAPAIYLELGRLHASHAKLAFEVAKRMEQRGRMAEAETHRQIGKTQYEKCQRPFALVIKLAKTFDLRGKAHQALGEVLMELEEYEQARVEFSRLADDPETDELTRIHATRRWADALRKLRRNEQALQKLLPQVRLDLASAVTAGQLQEEQGQYRDAYETYQAGLPRERPNDPKQKALAAELLYRAQVLTLTRPERVFESSRVETEQDRAVQTLQTLIDTYPGTKWAQQSILSLGDWFLSRRRWRTVLTLVQQHRVHTPLHQTLDLIEGRAHVQGEQIEKARDALTLAAQDRKTGSFSRRIAAAALRDLGTISRDQQQWDKALEYYGKVFAQYHDITDEADAARIDAAKAYLQSDPVKGRSLAKQVLENGHDLPLLQRTYFELVGAQGSVAR